MFGRQNLQKGREVVFELPVLSTVESGHFSPSINLPRSACFITVTAPHTKQVSLSWYAFDLVRLLRNIGTLLYMSLLFLRIVVFVAEKMSSRYRSARFSSSMTWRFSTQLIYSLRNLLESVLSLGIGILARRNDIRIATYAPRIGDVNCRLRCVWCAPRIVDASRWLHSVLTAPRVVDAGNTSSPVAVILGLAFSSRFAMGGVLRHICAFCKHYCASWAAPEHV